jgi:hypothetical protein
MSSRNAQRGAVDMILIGVVLVSAICIAGYAIYQRGQEKPISIIDNLYPKKPKTSSQTGSSLVITQWGVAMPISDTSLHIKYSVNTFGSFDAAYISTAELEKAGEAHKMSGKNYCTAEDGALGAIGRYKPGAIIMDTPVERIGTKVGAYYYTYDGPQGTCAVDSATNSMQVSQTKIIKSAFAGIKAK